MAEDSSQNRKVAPSNRREQLATLRQQQTAIHRQLTVGKLYGRTAFIVMCCIIGLYGTGGVIFSAAVGSAALALGCFWYLDDRVQLASLRIASYRVAQIEEGITKKNTEDDFIRFQYSLRIDRPINMFRSIEPLVWTVVVLSLLSLFSLPFARLH